LVNQRHCPYRLLFYALLNPRSNRIILSQIFTALAAYLNYIGGLVMF
jgi:hypothetical protein